MTEFLKERWLAIALAVVAVVFIAQNRDDASVSLLWLEVTWPMWLALTVVTLIGVALGFVLSGRRRRAAED